MRYYNGLGTYHPNTHHLTFECKVTTFFANVPTNNRKIYETFQENVFYVCNVLIYRWIFSETVGRIDKLS